MELNFPLAHELINLNSASYGVPTCSLLSEAARLRNELEQDTAFFLGSVLVKRLEDQARELQNSFLPDYGTCVLTQNATESSNSLAQSLSELGVTSVVMFVDEYESVKETWQKEARAGSIEFIQIPLPMYVSSSDFLLPLRKILTSSTVLVLSTITSSRAIRTPVEEISQFCHEKGTLLVLDASHSLGHEEIDWRRCRPHAVFGSLHKWIPVPRPCGFLWIDSERIFDIKPALVANRRSGSFSERFSWRGTWDPTNALLLALATEQWKEFRECGLLEEKRQLTNSLYNKLQEMGLVACTSPQLLAPRMRSLYLPGYRAEVVKKFLHKRKIRLWIHSGPDDVTLLRYSMAPYNRGSDCESLLDALQDLMGEYG